METKLCRFVNGPLHDQMVEVPITGHYMPVVCVDQVVPLETDVLPPLQQMVRPFKEIWTYDRHQNAIEEWSFFYVGRLVTKGGPKCEACGGRGFFPYDETP